MKLVTEVMFTQMSAKAGIKKFGDNAVVAIVKEYIQIDKGPMEGRPVVTPIGPGMLSYKDTSKALEEVNIIKENRNGIVKGRKCEYGIKQKMYLKEGESISSPTVSLEDLFFTLIVDTHKGRNMATFNVPEVYIHSDMPKDKRILMKLRGYFVDIMCQVNP